MELSWAKFRGSSASSRRPRPLHSPIVQIDSDSFTVGAPGHSRRTDTTMSLLALTCRAPRRLSAADPSKRRKTSSISVTSPGGRDASRLHQVGAGPTSTLQAAEPASGSVVADPASAPLRTTEGKKYETVTSPCPIESVQSVPAKPDGTRADTSIGSNWHEEPATPERLLQLQRSAANTTTTRPFWNPTRRIVHSFGGRGVQISSISPGLREGLDDN